MCATTAIRVFYRRDEVGKLICSLPSNLDHGIWGSCWRWWNSDINRRVSELSSFRLWVGLLWGSLKLSQCQFQLKNHDSPCCAMHVATRSFLCCVIFWLSSGINSSQNIIRTSNKKKVRLPGPRRMAHIFRTQILPVLPRSHSCYHLPAPPDLTEVSRSASTGHGQAIPDLGC